MKLFRAIHSLVITALLGLLLASCGTADFSAIPETVGKPTAKVETSAKATILYSQQVVDSNVFVATVTGYPDTDSTVSQSVNITSQPDQGNYLANLEVPGQAAIGAYIAFSATGPAISPINSTSTALEHANLLQAVFDDLISVNYRAVNNLHPDQPSVSNFEVCAADNSVGRAVQASGVSGEGSIIYLAPAGTIPDCPTEVLGADQGFTTTIDVTNATVTTGAVGTTSAGSTVDGRPTVLVTTPVITTFYPELSSDNLDSQTQAPRIRNGNGPAGPSITTPICTAVAPSPVTLTVDQRYWECVFLSYKGDDFIEIVPWFGDISGFTSTSSQEDNPGSTETSTLVILQ